MGWENKVVWTEGLFLQPQHLQQQERYFERLVRTSTGGLRPYAWGLTQLELDTDLLTLGKFAIRSVAGLLPDGTPFSVPGDVDHPRPLELLETAAQQRGLSDPAGAPARRHGNRARRLDRNRGPLRHGRARGDRHQRRLPGTAVVPIGKLRLRFALEGDAREGHASIGLARVADVRADKSVHAGRKLHSAPAADQCISGMCPASPRNCRACCTTGPRHWPAAYPKPPRAARRKSPIT